MYSSLLKSCLWEKKNFFFFFFFGEKKLIFFFFLVASFGKLHSGFSRLPSGPWGIKLEVWSVNQLFFFDKRFFSLEKIPTREKRSKEKENYFFFIRSFTDHL